MLSVLEITRSGCVMVIPPAISVLAFFFGAVVPDVGLAGMGISFSPRVHPYRGPLLENVRNGSANTISGELMGEAGRIGFYFWRNALRLMSGQNSVAKFLARSNPILTEPSMNPSLTVLSRSGYHWFERKAEP